MTAIDPPRRLTRGSSRLSLVVPCFNEEARLVARDLCDARLAQGGIELVLVDDGSTDGTRAILEQIQAQRAPGSTVVVSYTPNRGKAEAVRLGVVEALSRSPDAVGFWDADMATPLSELQEFVDVLERRADIDVVMGSRVKLMGRVVERQAWRHYMGRLFATMASVTLQLPIYDTQCGAKLFRATPVMADVFSRPFLARWVFDVEILARFLALDPRGREAAARSIYELPLRRWVDVRGSKIKPRDFGRAAVDLATIYAKYGSRKA